ncbi:TPA: 16S rRNA pseudouridine(516) synthase [Streptococcus agalactiae]
MRLDKLLGQAGFGSRNQVKKLICSRQVSVDGQIVTKDNVIVDSGLQSIFVGKERVCLKESSYYLLYKPSGVVSAVRDSEHKTVIDLISEKDKVEGLYPIGRLDRDTEGLLIITNNGPLGYRMLHPKHHVAKTYYVEVNGFLERDAITFFEEGVVVFDDGTKCKPAELTIDTANNDKSTARITITEGKFHQVKKMFLAYGVKVIYLRRISFGDLRLDMNLKPGQYRRLRDSEAAILKRYLD